MTLAQILQFTFSGLTLGCIYGLVALGFTIIFNATGIVNFAQGDFVMLGALLTATFVTQLAMPLLTGIALAVLCVGLIGALMERLLIHGLKNDKNLFASVMLTLAASIVLNAGALLLWGADPHHVNAFSGEKPIAVHGATLLPQMIWIAGGVALVIGLLITFFKATWLGQAMLASSMNRDAAAAMGVNVSNMMLLSFACSAAIGGFGGALVAPITMATHDMGGLMTLKGFTAAILGGLGSVPGALIGGLLLGLLESLSSGFISSGYRDAIALALLLVFLMVKPSGLAGVKITKH